MFDGAWWFRAICEYEDRLKLNMSKDDFWTFNAGTPIDNHSEFANSK